MAINLGGGGVVNPYQGTAGVTAGLMQQQATAQQNLQEQQKNAFTYIQMLPQLAQQMGYAPEQLHLFLEQQAPQIMGQLGVLGVGDPQGALAGMIRETTLGQRYAGETEKFITARQGELEAEAGRQGLTGTERSRFLLAGSPGEAPTYETTTEIVEGTGTPEVTYDIDLDNLAKQSPEDIISNWNYSTHGNIQRIIQHLNANKGNLSDTDTVQLNAINDIWKKKTNQTENIRNLFEIYNRVTTEGITTKVPSKEEDFVDQRRSFAYDIPEDYRGGISENELRSQNSIKLVEGLEQNQPELVNIYIKMSDEERKAAIKRYLKNTQDGISPMSPNDQYIALKALNEQRGVDADPIVSDETVTAPAVSPAGTVTSTVAGTAPTTQQVTKQTSPGTPEVLGLGGSVQQLQQQVARQSPFAAQSVMPGEQAFREGESQIAYRNELIQQARAANQVQLVQSFNELEKARIEGQLNVEAKAVENFYDALTEKYKVDIEGARTEEQKEAVARAYAEEAATALRTYDVNVNSQDIVLDDRAEIWQRIFPNWDNQQRQVRVFGSGTVPLGTGTYLGQTQEQGQTATFEDLMELLHRRTVNGNRERN